MATGVTLKLPTDSAVILESTLPQIGDMNPQNYLFVPINALLTGNTTTAECLVGSISWKSNGSSIDFYTTISFSRNGLPCLLDPKDSSFSATTPQVQKVLLCDIAECQKSVYAILSQFTAFG